MIVEIDFSVHTNPAPGKKIFSSAMVVQPVRSVDQISPEIVRNTLHRYDLPHRSWNPAALNSVFF